MLFAFLAFTLISTSFAAETPFAPETLQQTEVTPEAATGELSDAIPVSPIEAAPYPVPAPPLEALIPASDIETSESPTLMNVNRMPGFSPATAEPSGDQAQMYQFLEENRADAWRAVSGANGEDADPGN